MTTLDGHEAHLVHRWLLLAYGSAERHDAPRPHEAARLLGESGAILSRANLVAAAVGDVDRLRSAGVLAAPNAPLVASCPECRTTFALPPLCAVTHSSLLGVAQHAPGLRAAARELLAAGADPNGTWSVAGHDLSALYGAAGKNHDEELARLLLKAGADPDDGESLYHAVERTDHACLRLLLEHGARVEGSNALHHVLDRDDLEGLRLLLARCADPNDATSPLGAPLLWALRRRRSLAHVRALVDAGADPRAQRADGTSAYVLALRFGLTEVAELLRSAGADERLSESDRFLAACARADEAEARALLERTPDLLQRLGPDELRLLPDLIEAGRLPSARLMVALGWPIDVRGGDWDASAINLAVFRGDAALTRFLLEHGASWAERHGFGDHTTGTLSWASRNRPPFHGDWVGCARALIDHGMPVPPAGEPFSPEVAAFFEELRRG